MENYTLWRGALGELGELGAAGPKLTSSRLISIRPYAPTPLAEHPAPSREGSDRCGIRILPSTCKYLQLNLDSREARVKRMIEASRIYTFLFLHMARQLRTAGINFRDGSRPRKNHVQFYFFKYLKFTSCSWRFLDCFALDSGGSLLFARLASSLTTRRTLDFQC